MPQSDDAQQSRWLPVGGAPLDVVKLAAAVLMVGDHVNFILLGQAEPLLWHFGRIAFPLFCYVVACHLLRGAEPRRYLVLLLVFAVPTQPIFALAFGNQLGSILFTLAAGTALALLVRQVAPWVTHAIFASGIVVAFAFPGLARTGVDFGLAGMLLPAAMLAALSCGGIYLLWLVLLLFVLNADAVRPAGEPWWWGALIDGAFATGGTLLIVFLSAVFANARRFLPRYALYLFYPGHLAALSLLRRLL